MKSRKLIISVAILVVYMGIIFILSSLPGDLLTPEKEYGFLVDSAIKHFVEFSILGIFMANVFLQLARENVFNRGFLTFSVSVAFSAFYGVLDEVHQSFVPTRYSTILDMLINMMGSIVGVAIFLAYNHRTNREDRKIL